MRNYYQNIYRQKYQRGKVVPSLLVILASVILGLIYLMQVNSGVTKSYQIREYQKHLKEAQKTQQEFQIMAAQWQSLPNVKELIKNLEMVEVEKISYLNISGSEVAAMK